MDGELSDGSVNWPHVNWRYYPRYPVMKSFSLTNRQCVSVNRGIIKAAFGKHLVPQTNRVTDNDYDLLLSLLPIFLLL